ncbi:uncharacterized protein KY384_009254 [Bacidia gigantensis]|uniref:uncharacterized protein n=1 Tax=Bacidia gigantensis TaxID=2732470 RepID=UPI001D044B19|nr:uncharacterized protein KY384_009254 [Bacidia gigantensis]KAG8525610.1 hypothetical protein KY384_009254 [Bacidia gigantensis]
MTVTTNPMRIQCSYNAKSSLLGNPRYTFLLNYLGQPQAVLEGRARRRAYMTGDISKEEYYNPKLLERRRAKERAEQEITEKRADRWDEIRREEKERDREFLERNPGMPRHPGS